MERKQINDRVPGMAIVDEVGFNQRDAKEMVELFFQELSDNLEAGGEVKLAGFGSSACAISQSDQEETPRLVKTSLLRPDGSSHGIRAAI